MAASRRVTLLRNENMDTTMTKALWNYLQVLAPEDPVEAMFQRTRWPWILGSSALIVEINFETYLHNRESVQPPWVCGPYYAQWEGRGGPVCLFWASDHHFYSRWLTPWQTWKLRRLARF